MQRAISVSISDSQPKTIVQQLEKNCSEFCIDYCKYSEQADKAMENDDVYEKCFKCPIKRIL